MKKIVITGAGGQLASEMFAMKENYPHLDMIFLNSQELNIIKFPAVSTTLKDIQPDVVINCAAYTAVDKAETEQNLCFEVNKIGPFNLSRVCNEIGAHFIHISTDFVYDGTQSMPYIESDSTQPISNYGKSKLQGELEIIENTKSYSIIRTSWLYSSFGHNFVKTMLRLGAEKESLNVVFDQIGTPTYARDLALVILENIERLEEHKNNIYHYSNEGVASWYDFALEVMAMGHLNCAISPIRSAEYPTPAKRPNYSVMDKSKIKKHLNIQIPHWKTSLETCIQVLSSQQPN